MTPPTAFFIPKNVKLPEYKNYFIYSSEVIEVEAFNLQTSNNDEHTKM